MIQDYKFRQSSTSNQPRRGRRGSRGVRLLMLLLAAGVAVLAALTAQDYWRGTRSETPQSASTMIPLSLPPEGAGRRD